MKIKSFFLIYLLIAAFQLISCRPEIDHSLINLTINNSSTENATISKRQLDTFDASLNQIVPGEASPTVLGVANTGSITSYKLASNFRYYILAQSPSFIWEIKAVYIDSDDFNLTINNLPIPSPAPGSFTADNPTQDQVFNGIDPAFSIVTNRLASGTIYSKNTSCTNCNTLELTYEIFKIEKIDANRIYFYYGTSAYQYLVANKGNNTNFPLGVKFRQSYQSDKTSIDISY
jgi:hypothetical protein